MSSTRQQCKHCICPGFEDLYGTAVLLDTQEAVKAQKRPNNLLPTVPDMPMHVAKPSKSRTFAGRLFAGHPSLKWLCACFLAVHELRVSRQQESSFLCMRTDSLHTLLRLSETNMSVTAGQVACQGAFVGADSPSGC